MVSDFLAPYSDNGFVAHSYDDCSGEVYLGNNSIGLYLHGYYTDSTHFAFHRSYAQFDTSAIPAGATITKVEAGVTMYSSTTQSLDQSFYKMTSQLSSFATAQDLYDGITDSSEVYATFSLAAETPTVINLGATAVSDLASHKTWFGLGITNDEETLINYIMADTGPIVYSTHGGVDTDGKKIFLRVTYTVGGRTRVMYFD